MTDDYVEAMRAEPGKWPRVKAFFAAYMRSTRCPECKKLGHQCPDCFEKQAW